MNYEVVFKILYLTLRNITIILKIFFRLECKRVQNLFDTFNS